MRLSLQAISQSGHCDHPSDRISPARRTDPCGQMTARDGPCGSKAFGTHSQPSLQACNNCTVQFALSDGSWKYHKLYTACDLATYLANRLEIGLRDCSIAATKKDRPLWSNDGKGRSLWFEGIRDTFATFPDSSNYNCIVQFDLSDGPATFLAGIHWRLVREVAVLQRPRRTDPCSQMTARDGPCGSKAFGTHSQPSLIAQLSWSSLYLTENSL